MNAALTGGVDVSTQFAVIAIVACAVFGIGVILVLYRKRRTRGNLPNLEHHGGTGALAHYAEFDGVPLAPPTTAGQRRRKRARRLGPEPKVWDVEVGAGAESDSDDESGVGKKGEDEDELWRPISTAVPSHDASDPPSLDVTVLIAMPDPAAARADYDDDGHIYHLPAAYAYTDPDEGVLPPLELGCTRLPAAAVWSELTALVPPPPPRPREERRQRERVQRVRVDGFSRFRR